MSIPALPTPPIRGAADFSVKAAAWVDALTYQVAPAIDMAATEVATNAAAANAAAAAALSYSAATAWVSGTTYAVGDVRWSPANRLIYRRTVAGAGTTDPGADPTNWALADGITPTAHRLNLLFGVI